MKQRNRTAKLQQKTNQDRTHPPRLIWQGADYACVPEGCYQAVAIRHQGPQWVRQFSRWKLLLEFVLLDDESHVCLFYNFNGDQRSGPIVANRGRYRADWIRANGDQPRRGQEMSPDVFLEGQLYTLEVRNTVRNSDQTEKACGEIYSQVKSIIIIERSGLHVPTEEPQAPIKQESLNLEAFNQKSRKQASRQAGLATKTADTAAFPANFASAGRRSANAKS
jgi:hypothetical protein